MVNSIYGANASTNLLSLSFRQPGTFTPSSNAANNIRATLDASGYEANRSQIINIALNRIRGIVQNVIQPSSEWETKAGYLTSTAQPFKLIVTSSGKITTDAQVESDLFEYSVRDREKLKKAIGDLKDIASQVDLQNTKDNLRYTLQAANLKAADMEDNYFPANTKWEKDFNLYRSLGQPVKLSLDSDGNVVAVNQLDHDFMEVEDDTKRQKLQQASFDLKLILQGKKSATESWQYSALGYKSEGQNYFLDTDENGDVVVRQNQDVKKSTSIIPSWIRDTIGYSPTEFYNVPDFLKTKPEDRISYKESWQKDAIDLYQAKKPFYLDVVGGKIVAKENNYVNVLRESQRATQATDPLLQARLNLLS